MIKLKDLNGLLGINMKQLNQYITEKLRINKDSNKIEYHYHPKDRDELRSLITELL